MIKNLAYARRARLLLLAVAVLMTSAAAAAQKTVVTLANSGNWTAAQGSSWNASVGRNEPTCVIGSGDAPDGRLLGIGVNSVDQQFQLAVTKPSWHIPANAHAAVSLQIDDYPAWSANASHYNNTSLVITLGQSDYHEFIQQITSGAALVVRFTGNEPPWVFSLQGMSEVWGPFVQCTQNAAPAFANALDATQPYAPTQPYGPARSP